MLGFPKNPSAPKVSYNSVTCLMKRKKSPLLSRSITFKIENLNVHSRMSANISAFRTKNRRDATMATLRDTPHAAEGRGGWTERRVSTQRGLQGGGGGVDREVVAGIRTLERGQALT